jgi:hypothetical protein
MNALKWSAGLWVPIWLLSSVASAQSQEPSRSRTSAPLSLTKTVQASFRIEPIVHRFAGRRGEVIPFAFEITSLGKEMDLKAIPVNLRQEESGVILHDPSGQPLGAVVLTSPEEFRIGPGESKQITGEVTIPIAKTNYISLGILVQDRGKAPDFSEDAGSRAATQAGIRFVTQYVLRIDIETGHADPKQFSQLRIEQGKVTSQQGLPWVSAYLDNPTNFAYECRVRAALDAGASGKSTPVFLGMPSRSSLEDEGKTLVRIMPQSRLRLESPVDFPLFSGPQTLSVGVTNGRREVAGAEFELELAPTDFPGLQAQVAYVGAQLAVSPSQVEVGTARGASRMLGLKFVNSAAVEQSVELSARSLAGEPMVGLKLSPDHFQIGAGKSKHVRVQVQAVRGDAEDGIGEIHIVAQAGSASPAEQALPLWVRRTPRSVPQLVLSDLELVDHQGRTAFRLLVDNRGASFVPVHAELQLATAGGQALLLSAGFGQWIRPGATRALLFVPQQELPSGDCLLSLEVATGDEDPVERRTLSIRLEPPAEPAQQSDQAAVRH